MGVDGERFVPEEHDIVISLEHWHRYLHITDLVTDKKVLDIASGTGYGSNILAQNAGSVIGVDISEQAIEYARDKYVKSNLEYQVGSIENIPFEENTFDVVISFETIEHVSEELQQKFLREVTKVLKEDGIFIVSTPEKYYYSDLRNYKNEFHIKEFYEDEFKEFLNPFFSNIQFNYQTTLIGSNIFSDDRETRVSTYAEPKEEGASKEYLIAYCSNQEKGLVKPKPSINIDKGNNFFSGLNANNTRMWERIHSSESKLEASQSQVSELWRRVHDNEEAIDNYQDIRACIKNWLKALIK